MPNTTLNHYAYCGMTVPLGSGDLDTMRSKAARILRRRRAHGFPVVKLDSGEWEIQCPETAVMVSDHCGVMRMETEADEEDDFDA